jgi:protoporphyrinogen oxidase
MTETPRPQTADGAANDPRAATHRSATAGAADASSTAAAAYGSGVAGATTTAGAAGGASWSTAGSGAADISVAEGGTAPAVIDTDVVVVGAGMSGLAAARALAGRGLRVVVVEAAGRPGGVLVSAARGGFLAELGPNTVQESPALLALAADAGCAEELVPAAAAARRRFLVHRGRLVALPAGPPGLLTTPLLTWRGKARLATEPWRRRGSGPQESVAAFFHRRLGREALPLADAMGLGVFAGDPEELAMGYAFRRAYALEHEHGSLLRGMLRAAPGAARRLLACRGGFASLGERLAAGLDVRCGLPAVAVARDADGRFLVTAGHGDQTIRLAARRLVTALPAHATATLLSPLAATLAPGTGATAASASAAAAGRPAVPASAAAASLPTGPASAAAASLPTGPASAVAGGLPTGPASAAAASLPTGPASAAAGGLRTVPAAAAPPGAPAALAAIARIPHAPVAVVALGYARGAVAHPLDGFGFLAPHREGRRVLGCLFSSSLFADRAPAGHVLLTAMVGGRRRAELLDGSDDELAGVVREELAALLGARGEPALTLVRRWVPGIPQPDARWPEARDAARALEAAAPGLTVLGSWLHGVGVPDCAAAGWSLAQD